MAYYIDDNGTYYTELSPTLYLNTDTSELLFKFTGAFLDIYRLLEDGSYRYIEDNNKRLIEQ